MTQNESAIRRGGMREAHCHLPNLGRSLSLLNVAEVKSKTELYDTLKNAAEKLRKDEWVIATGMRIEGWSEAVWPTRVELDAVTVGRPCVVRGFDYHSLAANSAALLAAGIRDSSPNPEAGIYRRDSSGRLDGVCLEAAANHVWNAVPEPTPAEREMHVRAGLRHFADLGFVEIDDLLTPRWLGEMLAKMDDAGELTMKVRLFPPVAELAAAARDAKTWERENVILEGGKLFADGSLNSRTAWMLEPYADGIAGQECGLPNWSSSQIEDAVKECERHGVILATHAIGDRAVREVLNAIERVGSGKYRHRIEHCEVTDEKDVPRFAQLGVVASVQPCHLLYDIEVLQRGLPHRLDRVLPLREFIDTGCKPGELLIFGSDAPIVPADPRDSVQAAVHRRRAGMEEAEAIAIGQAMSEEESWMSFGTEDV